MKRDGEGEEMTSYGFLITEESQAGDPDCHSPGMSITFSCPPGRILGGGCSHMALEVLFNYICGWVICSCVFIS